MPAPLVLAMFLVFSIVGAALKGPIGLIGGAGAAFLLWMRHRNLVEGLEEERRRRENGEPQFTRFWLILVSVLVAALLLVCAGMMLNWMNQA